MSPPDGETSLRVATLDSPVGPLLVAADDAWVWLVEYAAETRARRQLDRVSLRLNATVADGCTPLTEQLGEELAEYFAGRLTKFTTPVKLVGTPFQGRIWAELCRIPAGQTTSYAELARRIDRPTAVRAVGAANGANPISILVPCHRVVNTGGGLGGYGGGLDRKRWLLEHEQRVSGQRLFV
ncbi:MAG: methylated-DNA--[protein]-cysteine S-methyltransferase [Planctomycetota bacterium]